MLVLSTRRPLNYSISQKGRKVRIDCDGNLRSYEIPLSTVSSEIFEGQYKAECKTWDESRSLDVNGCKFIFFSESGVIERLGERINVRAGTLAVIDEEKILSGSGICIVIANYSFPFSLIESSAGSGVLNYISGCSTTPLWGPHKKGFPCAHTLFMPPGIDQANHWHPTVRFGLIFSGRGHFVLAGEKKSFSPGTVLVLDPGDEHSFHTTDCAAAFLAFHPDSTTGPTDEDHPMLDRTYIDEFHGRKIRDLI
jgi:Cupin domain